MRKPSQEFQNFDNTMRKLISVPHSEIKAKLEMEKALKKAKKSEGKVKHGEARRTD